MEFNCKSCMYGVHNSRSNCGYHYEDEEGIKLDKPADWALNENSVCTHFKRKFNFNKEMLNNKEKTLIIEALEYYAMCHYNMSGQKAKQKCEELRALSSKLKREEYKPLKPQYSDTDYVLGTNVSYKHKNGHYEVYQNGQLRCTCDAGELDEIIKGIKGL